MTANCSMCWPIRNTLFSNSADCTSMPRPVTPRWISAPERGDRGEHAAHDVVDAGAGPQRIARPSGHVREAAHHLHDLVERRAVIVRPRQEALVAHVDEPRVRLRQRRVVEAVLHHRARLEVLDDDVGAARAMRRATAAPSG